MKIVRFLSTLLALVISAGFISCSKDNDDEKESSSQTEKVADEIKWVSSNPNDKFASLEFNKSGNYIIVENIPARSTIEQRLYFGTYTITDNSMISLSGIGTIKVINVTENTVSLEITLNGTSYPVTFSGSKSENMAGTAKTDLLCRTWKIIKYNGGTESVGAIVLFTKAGTYYVIPNETNEDSHGGLGQWKWKQGTNETQLLYTLDGSFDGSFITINTLTNSSLKITEVFEDNEVDTWELEPITNVRSSIATAKTSQ